MVLKFPERFFQAFFHSLILSRLLSAVRKYLLVFSCLFVHVCCLICVRALGQMAVCLLVRGGACASRHRWRGAGAAALSAAQRTEGWEVYVRVLAYSSKGTQRVRSLNKWTKLLSYGFTSQRAARVGVKIRRQSINSAETSTGKHWFSIPLPMEVLSNLGCALISLSESRGDDIFPRHTSPTVNRRRWQRRKGCRGEF